MGAAVMQSDEPADCRYTLGQEDAMSINKDQVKGRVEEVKGAIKEATGKLVGDQKLEVKGNVQKNVGKVQAALGDVKKDIKDASK